jgi:hypothetical protein
VQQGVRSKRIMAHLLVTYKVGRVDKIVLHSRVILKYSTSILLRIHMSVSLTREPHIIISLQLIQHNYTRRENEASTGTPRRTASPTPPPLLSLTHTSNGLLARSGKGHIIVNRQITRMQYRIKQAAVRTPLLQRIYALLNV